MTKICIFMRLNFQNSSLSQENMYFALVLCNSVRSVQTCTRHEWVKDGVTNLQVLFQWFTHFL